MVFCECLFGLYADIGCMAVFRRQTANQFVLRTVTEKGREMLSCTVKFCGGCNPHFDRGAFYRELTKTLADVAVFTPAEPGRHYDVLVLLHGCESCADRYEEICAAHRILVTHRVSLHEAADAIRALCR